jgi:hypothetical protein
LAAMILTVLVNPATVAVAEGPAPPFTSRILLPGFLVMLTALISGVVGDGYTIWRTHKTGLRPSTVGKALDPTRQVARRKRL